MDKRESIVQKKAYIFAVKIVKVYQRITTDKKEFILSKQLLKSGTSIGANISEANGGISVNDFSAKMSIAYKESLETKYWLNLLFDTGYLSQELFETLFQDVEELCKMLFTIIKTTRFKSQ